MQGFEREQFDRSYSFSAFELPKKPKEKKEKIFHFCFDSLEDYLHKVEKGKVCLKRFPNPLSDTKDFFFFETESLKEAIALCRHPKIETLQDFFRLKEEMDFVVSDFLSDRIPQIVPWQRTYMNRVIGTFPNIPRYVEGHPDCMKKPISSDADSRSFHYADYVLPIYCNIGYEQGHLAELIRLRGSLVLAFIEQLEKMGIFVDLKFYLAASCPTRNDYWADEHFITEIKVKKPNEEFDIIRNSFIMLSPDFLRRIEFRHREITRRVGPFWACSYGTTMDRNFLREQLQISKDAILLPDVDDLKTSFYSNNCVERVAETFLDAIPIECWNLLPDCEEKGSGKEIQKRKKWSKNWIKF